MTTVAQKQPKRSTSRSSTPETSPQSQPRPTQRCPDAMSEAAMKEAERLVYGAGGDGVDIDNRMDEASLWELLCLAFDNYGYTDDDLAVRVLECSAAELNMARLAARDEEGTVYAVGCVLNRLHLRMIAMAELSRRFTRAQGGNQ
jgi:hypothetical protein